MTLTRLLAIHSGHQSSRTRSRYSAYPVLCHLEQILLWLVVNISQENYAFGWAEQGVDRYAVSFGTAALMFLFKVFRGRRTDRDCLPTETNSTTSSSLSVDSTCTLSRTDTSSSNNLLPSVTSFGYSRLPVLLRFGYGSGCC